MDDHISPRQSAGLRIPAQLLSYIFHPLFIPVYVTAYLLYINPYAFNGIGEKSKLLKLIFVWFNTSFVPAFAVFLMWRLGLIESIFLRTKRERIIPYSAALICYFWAWFVARNQLVNPSYFIDFLFGTFLAVTSGWMLNIYTKISMHAIAMGGLVVFFFLQAFSEYSISGIYLSLAIIIAGLVCTARFIVSDHVPFQVYLGFIAGAFCQLVAYWL